MTALLFALAAAQTSLPPATAEASNALALCAVAEAQRRASEPGPAEAAAEAALSACSSETQRLFEVFASVLGPLDDEDKRTLTAPLRAQLTRIVNEHRGLVPRRQNHATALGDCVRARAPVIAAQAGASEALVDTLLQQCRAETDALRAGLVRDRGEASANRIMPGVLESLRTLARQQLDRARAAR